MALRFIDGSVSDPVERLHRIHALGREVAPIDRAMRLWAQQDHEVAEAVRCADENVVGQIAGCLVDHGFTTEEAELRAMVMLRALVGGHFVEYTARTGPDPYQRTLALFLGVAGTALA
jgi:hypothetical protein